MSKIKYANVLSACFLLHTSSLIAQNSSTRLEEVLGFVRSHEPSLRDEILAQTELRQELGIEDAAAKGAGFRYEMAFQNSFLKSGTVPGMDTVDELVEDSQEVIIPFCFDKTCVLAAFDNDDESGELVMTSYGSSGRASRIAEGYERLKKLRPDYKGDAKIVEYPAGKLDFLVVDGPNGQKEFIASTDEQAKRLKNVAGKDSAFIDSADLSELVASIDENAQRNAVIEGSDDDGPMQSGGSTPATSQTLSLDLSAAAETTPAPELKSEETVSPSIAKSDASLSEASPSGFPMQLVLSGLGMLLVISAAYGLRISYSRRQCRSL